MTDITRQHDTDNHDIQFELHNQRLEALEQHENGLIDRVDEIEERFSVLWVGSKERLEALELANSVMTSPKFVEAWLYSQMDQVRELKARVAELEQANLPQGEESSD